MKQKGNVKMCCCNMPSLGKTVKETALKNDVFVKH